MKIFDNGKGFVYSDEMKICGNGISNMKERVNLLNGSIEIDSVKRKEQLLKLRIPLNNLKKWKKLKLY